MVWAHPSLYPLPVKSLTRGVGGAGHGRPGAVKDGAQRKEQLALIKDRESKRSLGHLPTDHSMQRLEVDY